MIQLNWYKYISHNELILEYSVTGNGSTPVICLHGHGRSIEDYNFLNQEPLKIIAIHLFFHGSSYFPDRRIEKKPLQPEEWQQLMMKLLEKEKIEQFHLLAFSQGGRFALKTLEQIPEKILSLTLLAPDGMEHKSLYNWSSRRKILRKIFKNWEQNPQQLRYLSKYAFKIKLLRPKVYTFIEDLTDSRQKIERASKTWRAFRNINSSPEILGKNVLNFNIPLVIIMGKYDQIIRPQQAYQFVKKMGLENKVIEIENGHHFFKPTSIIKFYRFLPFLEH